MELQLHDSSLDASRFGRFFNRARTTAQRALTYTPQYQYYRAARSLYNRRPSWLREDGDLSQPYDDILTRIQGTPTYAQFIAETGLDENDPQLASKFGRWVKTKAVPGIQKIQQKLAPVIGLLPGGGAINTAFDIVNRARGDKSGPAVQPVVVPQPEPAFIGPQIGPQPFAPPPMVYQGNPMILPEPPRSRLPFGLTPLTLGLLGIGGIIAYKVLTKK